MRPWIAVLMILPVLGCGNALKATGELDADTDRVDDGTDGSSGCTSDEECDDGNPCNGSETCGSDGECDPGTPLSDGAPCEQDGVEGTCRDEVCVPVTCGDGDLDAGEECDDGNATSGDGCEDTCRFSCHEDSECADENVCTDDVCEEGGTGQICAHENNTAECDDGNPCTEGDTCSGGTCTPGTNTCECETTADCAEHEDGDLCNGTLVCSPETHTCVVDPGTVVTCPPTSTVCHQLECVPSTGLCEDDNPAEGTACEDDLDACTDDVCDGAGACTHPAITCTDGNVCTDDSCNSSTGCVFTNNSAACDDGNACTGDDYCAGGTCHGGMGIACNDRNQCTDDSCDTTTGCVFTPHTRGCDDGDPCTTGDTCDGAGHCVGTDLPVWYLDDDDDGYGDTSTAVCAATAPTSDYVSTDGDCCDINFDVNPGVTGWFTEAFWCGSTLVDFDYDCSGVEERRWTSIGSCTWDSATGACIHVAGWLVGSGTGVPACGTHGSWLGGCIVGGTGVCNNGAVTSRLQQCH
jgi:cysteine-rich repeat protein